MACKPGEIIQLACTGEQICDSVQKTAENILDIMNHESRITTNEADISTIFTDVAKNKTDIFELQNDITATNTLVASNTLSIDNNTQNIAKNVTDISENRVQIQRNTTDIAALSASNIGERVDNNTTSIASLQVEVNNHTSEILSIENDISANTSAISSNEINISALTTRVSTNENDIDTLETNYSSLPTLYAALSGSATQTFYVADPTEDTHAVSKKYGDANYANGGNYYTKIESDALYLGIQDKAYDSDMLGGLKSDKFVLTTMMATKDDPGIVRQATDSEAIAGIVDDCYMSPKQVADAIAAAP